MAQCCQGIQKGYQGALLHKKTPLRYKVGTPIPQVDAPRGPKTGPWHATPNLTLRQPPLEVRLPRLSQGGCRTFGATTPGCLCDYLGLSVRLLGCLEVVAG